MAAVNETEISGVIENVVFHSDATDYTVLELSVTGSDGVAELITAVGTLPPAGEGECLLLRGSFTRHPEYGRQFSFTSYEKSLPKAVDDILKYLSSRTVEGIGPVTALKIVNRFGADTFEVMENHPEWLADIPGITMKKAAKIGAAFREQADLRQVMMFCRDYLGTGETARVYKSFGAGAVGLIQDNPYILCNEDCAIPFEKVDAMAASLGYPAEGEHRLVSAYFHITRARTDIPVCRRKSLLRLPHRLYPSQQRFSRKRWLRRLPRARFMLSVRQRIPTSCRCALRKRSCMPRAALAACKEKRPASPARIFPP